MMAFSANVSELSDRNEPRTRERRAQNLLDLHELVRVTRRDHNSMRGVKRLGIDLFQRHVCLPVLLDTFDSAMSTSYGIMCLHSLVGAT